MGHKLSKKSRSHSSDSNAKKSSSANRWIALNHSNDPFTQRVYGFLSIMDETLDLSSPIPLEIGTIILLYYPTLEAFHWNQDTQHHGGGYTFCADYNATQIKYAQSQYSVLKSCTPMSAFIARQIQWTVKIVSIEQIPNVPSSRVYFQLGFIETEQESCISSYDVPLDNIGVEMRHLFAFEVHSGYNHFYKWGRDGADEKVKEFTHDGQFKQGDELSLIVDFHDRTCELYYNQQFVSVLYKKLPANILPILCCFTWSGMGGYAPFTLACSQWKVLRL
mmetsp:Transcript_51912/g.82821  ORF Transcript_51912/g.82821 Transcript_51912/m.82821 type:complete len:277 (-) Transcript_51912:684-1514(-)